MTPPEWDQPPANPSPKEPPSFLRERWRQTDARTHYLASPDARLPEHVRLSVERDAARQAGFRCAGCAEEPRRLVHTFRQHVTNDRGLGGPCRECGCRRWLGVERAFP